MKELKKLSRQGEVKKRKCAKLEKDIEEIEKKVQRKKQGEKIDFEAEEKKLEVERRKKAVALQKQILKGYLRFSIAPLVKTKNIPFAPFLHPFVSLKLTNLLQPKFSQTNLSSVSNKSDLT